MADKGGFRASIKTNEPGTSDEDAADATYNGADWNKGKWMYDASIKHDAGKKGWKDKGGWKAASHVREVQVSPKSSVSSHSASRSDYAHPDARAKEINLHLKPQYDYYYAFPSQPN